MIHFTAQIIAGLFASLLGFFNSVHTKATECGAHDGVQYCYYAGDYAADSAPNGASDKLIYFFHGFANDQTAWSWNSVTKRIEASWEKTHTPHPAIIAVTFGKLWWYTNRSQGTKLNAFSEWFEKSHLSKSPKERILYGDSMGGHNAFRWASDFPKQFSRMGLICPAMPYSFSGKSSTKAGWWPLAWIANDLIVNQYSSPTLQFESPLKRLATSGKDELIPKIHIIASTRDQFGFHDGDVALYRALKNAGVEDVEIEEQDIGHCQAETTKMADFLTRQ